MKELSIIIYQFKMKEFKGNACINGSYDAISQQVFIVVKRGENFTLVHNILPNYTLIIDMILF